MAKAERGYFGADQSRGGGREGYENFFSMDPALYTPSAFINVNPNTNEDLNDILDGDNFVSDFEYGSGMDTGYNVWGAQGNTYSLYPNLSTNQRQYGPALSTGANTNGFEQSFPHNDVDVQADPFSDTQTSTQISYQESNHTSTSDRTLKTAKSTVRRNPDTAITAPDEMTPKVKKTRGRRKTKEKSAEEKRAKEERKLERNRMAASKCRQKKKLATEEMMENFNELERQNHFMKACLEEVKQDRNKVLALLLEHKGCEHISVDKCLESQLERIAGEFEENRSTDTSMLGTDSLDSQADQFLNSNPTSPSDTYTSRRNSISVDSVALSTSGSNVSPHASPQISTKASVRNQGPHASQASAQKFPSGYPVWQNQFSMTQGHQDRFKPSSEAAHQYYTNSPTSCGSPGDSMSRQDSSHTSVFDDHQRTNSSISSVDTPPEERKKIMSDSPRDEAISLIAPNNIFQSQIPHMLPNQCLFSNSNHRTAVEHTPGQPNLKDPSTFLASLTRTSL